MSTTYRGYVLEVYEDRTDVVRWGVQYGSFESTSAASAFIDGRESA